MLLHILHCTRQPPNNNELWIPKCHRVQFFSTGIQAHSIQTLLSYWSPQVGAERSCFPNKVLSPFSHFDFLAAAAALSGNDPIIVNCSTLVLGFEGRHAFANTHWTGSWDEAPDTSDLKCWCQCWRHYFSSLLKLLQVVLPIPEPSGLSPSLCFSFLSIVLSKPSPPETQQTTWVSYHAVLRVTLYFELNHFPKTILSSSTTCSLEWNVSWEYSKSLILIPNGHTSSTLQICQDIPKL